MAYAFRSRPLARWADLVLIAIGLILSRFAYFTLFPMNYELLSRGELAGGFVVSFLTFWAALILCEGTGQQETWPLLFEQICVSTGLSLILHALLNYFGLLTRSFFLILVGALFAGFLLAIGRSWIYPSVQSSEKGVLMVGWGPMAEPVASALGQPILGAVGAPEASLPSEVPFLGELHDLEKIVREQRPAHILLASPAESALPSALLQLRLRGFAVNDVPALYERLFERVYCRGLEPAEMLLSPSLCADSRTLAIQAIYTNLIGLIFLIALSPIMIVVALAILLFARPGPAIESIECSGFQRIPFRLLRFRTLRSDGSGKMTGVGKVISCLHLANLPRLLNIVRGEIALFGPRPVRREFAQRLTEIMPFYAIRFFVKPGILGCAPTRPAKRLVSEMREIEYDLYYIKQASPILDLEILIRKLSGGRGRELPGPELAGSL